MVVAATRRHEMAPAMSFAQIFDDRTRFVDDVAIVLNQWRFSERMDGPQAGRSKIGDSVPLVLNDFIRNRQFLKQPKDALRPAVIEMMDFQGQRDSPS
jgi:hypothetical protein